MSESNKLDIGPHNYKWHQLAPKLLWVFTAALFVNFIWQSYQMAAGSADLTTTYGSMLAVIVLPPLWWYLEAMKRLQRVLVLRKNGEVAEFHWEWWPKARAVLLPPEFWHVYHGRRTPVLDCLEKQPVPIDVWRQDAGGVTSEDIARALEQSAARTIFESKSRRMAEIIKIGVLGMFVAGGALLIVVLSAPPKAG